MSFNFDSSLPILSAPLRVLLSLWLYKTPLSTHSISSWLSPSYQQKNIYSIISRLTRRGLVVFSRNKRSYELSFRGNTKVETTFPLLSQISGLSVSPNDSGQTTTQFAGVFLKGTRVSSSQRRAMLRFFSGWKFGRLMRGVYISPHNVSLEGFKLLVTSQQLAGQLRYGQVNFSDEETKALCESIWQISRRAQAWKMLFERTKEVSKIVRLKDQTSEIMRVNEELLTLLIADPILPSWLLPNDYAMRSVIESIISL